MPIQLQPDKFNHLREHIRLAKESNSKNRHLIKVKLATRGTEAYQRRRNSRIAREEFIKNNPEAGAIFDWIFEIKAKLKLNTEQFVKKINKAGGKVSGQTISLWKRRSGHSPCDRNYTALLRLDKEANLVNIEVKNIVKETTTKLILK